MSVKPPGNPAPSAEIARTINAARAAVAAPLLPGIDPALQQDIEVAPKAAGMQSSGQTEKSSTAPASPNPGVYQTKPPAAVEHPQPAAPENGADANLGKPAVLNGQPAETSPEQATAASRETVQSALATTPAAPQQTSANVTQIVAGLSTPPANSLSQAPSAGPARGAVSTADGDVLPNIAALAASIAAKSAAGSKTFDIRLDPADLGRVDVHLTVDNDGKVQAMVMADRPHTLELLQNGSHDLERSLKDAGLNLSNNSLNFSLKGEGRQGDGGGASMARARSLTSAVVARAEAVNASEMNFGSASGRLDIRV